jgi:hypothetical protein
MALYGKALFTRLLKEQLAWIAECGRDLTGYMDNYSRFDRTRENIEAIYRADTDELTRIKETLAGCR